MKRYIWILIPVLLLGIGLYLFREPLSTYFIESSISRSTKKIFGSGLSYQSVKKEGQKWIFDTPTLLSDTELPFQADKMELTVAMRPVKRELNLNVKVVRPKVDLEKARGQIRDLIKRLLSDHKLFKVNSEVVIEEGILSWIQDETSHVADFDFAIGSDSSGTHVLTRISIDGMDHEENSFQIELHQGEGDSVHAEMNFHEVAIADLSQAMKRLGIDLHGWYGKKGVINGNLSVHRLPNEKKFITSDLTFQDFKVSNDELEVEAEIKELFVQINEADDRIPSNPLLPIMNGQIELSEESSIIIREKGKSYWEVKQLVGGVFCDLQDGLRLVFEGKGNHEGHQFSLKLHGDARFDLDTQTSCTFALEMSAPDKPAATARFVARQLGPLTNCAEIAFKNFSRDEFAFFRTALIRYSPKWKRVHVHGGTIDGSGIAYLNGLQLNDLRIEELHAKELEFDIDTLGLCVRVDQTVGQISVDLSAEDILDTLDADFSIQDGQLKLIGYQDTWTFSGIHTDLIVREGEFQRSQIMGEFAGLEGKVAINWGDTDRAIKLDFSGGTKEVFKLMPSSVSDVMSSQFEEDQMRVTARVKRQPYGGEVTGLLRVVRGDKTDKIAFGFDFVKIVKSIWDHLSEEEGILGYVVKHGWFDAHNLPINQYIGPFVLVGEGIQFQGMGDFTGFFNGNSLAVEYDAWDISMEGKGFSVQVPKMPVIRDDPEALAPAAHFFDFKTGENYGFLPLENANYFDKSSGLLFTDVAGVASFENDQIELIDLDAFCNGVYFGGDIHLDLGKIGQGAFVANIHANTMGGTISQIRHLLMHFELLHDAMQLPIEGEVSFSGEGGRLDFNVTPEEIDWKMRFDAELANGELEWEEMDLTLKEVAVRIGYDSEKSLMELRELHGDLTVGEGEEYALVSDQILFKDLNRGISEFDIWAGNKNRDVLRIKGKSSPTKDEKIAFMFDREKTHFGNIHPSVCDLILTNLTEIDTFKLEFAFQFESCLQDLKRVARSGFLFLSKELVHEINEIKLAEGNCYLQCTFDPIEEQFVYGVSGSHLVFDEYRFETCVLQGKKKGPIWNIDQFQVDDYSFAADLLRIEDAWQFNFLGVRLKEAVLMGLEGNYFDSDQSFKGRVNLLEIELEQLKEWPELQAVVEDNGFKGQLRGSGEIRCQLGGQTAIDIILTTSLRNVEMRGVKFADTDDLSCHYRSDKGITFRHLHTKVLDEPVDLDIERVDYAFLKGKLKIEDCHYQVPFAYLSSVSEKLHRAFPDKITPQLQELIALSKQDGVLIGSLDFNMDPANISLKLSPQDDHYQLFGRDHHLIGCQIEVNSHEFLVNSEYKFEEQQFWLRLTTPSSDPTHGELIFSDHPIDSGKRKDQLVAYWKLGEDQQLKVEKIRGKFCGLHADLLRDPVYSEGGVHLRGNISFDVRRARKFLPKEIGDQIEQFQIGEGFSLKGQWNWRGEDYHFNGKLVGEKCEIKGMEIEQLEAAVDLKPERMEIRDVTMMDPCGLMTIKQINCIKVPEKGWRLSIPNLLVNKFRPSLVRAPGEPLPNKRKPLVIRDLVVEKLEGYLSDINSFKGDGKLTFDNRSRKMLKNNIFSFPAEMLQRIGLDLAVLTPVTGHIFYTIKDGKALFTRFKDIYSDKHLSKFYLPNTHYQSYVDFNGNLHVQVRMKQYNLVFKLAELFTVTIQGDILNPKYTLQKQRDSGANVAKTNES